jgi:hypothetical protein
MLIREKRKQIIIHHYHYNLLPKNTPHGDKKTLSAPPNPLLPSPTFVLSIAHKTLAAAPTNLVVIASRS